MAHTYEALRDDYRRFRAERDWDKFHDPKSVLIAVMGELGELAELMQWIPADEVRQHFASGVPHQRAGEELSDVLLYLTSLADALDIDLIEAAHAKLDAARTRFPVDDVRGVAPVHE